MRRPLRLRKKSQNPLCSEHLNQKRKPQACLAGSLKSLQHQRRRPPRQSSSQLTPRPRNLIRFLAKPAQAVLLDPRLPNPASLDPAMTQASQNRRPTLLRRCLATNQTLLHRRLKASQTPSHRRASRQKPQRPQKMRLCRRNQQVRPYTHLEIPRLLLQLPLNLQKVTRMPVTRPPNQSKEFHYRLIRHQGPRRHQRIPTIPHRPCQNRELLLWRTLHCRLSLRSPSLKLQHPYLARNKLRRFLTAPIVRSPVHSTTRARAVKSPQTRMRTKRAKVKAKAVVSTLRKISAPT